MLNVFSNLTLKLIFWKRKTFFKKLEYRFLVESTKIENAWFSYKTAISGANVKTNRMMSTKLTYRKERSFPVTTLFFRKFCFSVRTSYKEFIWCINDPNVHVRFLEGWSFIWQCFFLVSILHESFSLFPCIVISPSHYFWFMNRARFDRVYLFFMEGCFVLNVSKKGLPCPFLKIKKSALILEKSALIVTFW